LTFAAMAFPMPGIFSSVSFWKSADSHQFQPIDRHSLRPNERIFTFQFEKSLFVRALPRFSLCPSFLRLRLTWP
jgi:hypothetical protein